jgi:porin
LRIRNIATQYLLAAFWLPVACGFAFAADPSVSTTQATTTVSTQPASPPILEGITGDWFGRRSKLADVGLAVGGQIDLDFSSDIAIDLANGIHEGGFAFREITNLNFTLTSDQALGWKGGTFFFNFQNHEGQNGTVRLANDAQGFDNQDGPDATQLSQAWFQQTFDENKWRIKIGRVDANTEFDYVSNGTEFLNSSFGYSPAVFAFPTYPDPAYSANIFWTPCDYLYAGAGVYDSNRSERSLIFAGHPNDVKPSSGGVFSVAEIGAKWNLRGDDLPGRLGIGGYYHNGRFPRFDGDTQDGAVGMYADFDQTVWKSAATSDGVNNTLGIFAEYALADANVSLIDQQAGAGIVLTAPLVIFPDFSDFIGIGATYAHFSNHADLQDDYELAMEAFVKFQFLPGASIKPDLQYIIHPGGNGKPDILVYTIRLEIDF